MKNYLKVIMGVLCICLLLIQLTIVGIIYFPPNTFEGSYQSMLQIKYNVLRTVDEPKIIVISGISSAFGLDQNMLEEATGYKVANLGLQANIGPRFLAIVLYMSIFATANAITVAGNVDVRQQFIYFQF